MRTLMTSKDNSSTARRTRRATALRNIWDALPQFSAAQGKLRMASKIMQLKGVSWFGAEGAGRAPDGLWVHNATFYLRFLAESGFNAVRLPLALDNILSNTRPSVNMLSAARELHGLSYFQVLEQ